MVTFKDLSGTVAPEDFKDFVKFWFTPGQIFSLVGIPASGKGRKLHQTVSYEEITEEDIEEDFQQMCFFNGGMNLYFTVNPVLEDLGIHKRGGSNNIAAVRGLYADIDVNKEGKSGVFSSQDEILDYLETLDHYPSCVVESGSGGLHCYWLIDGGLTNDEGIDLQKRWWTYLNKMAGEKEIDRLVDISRILRVPGSIRFPKAEEVGRGVGEVRIIHFEENGIYTKEQILESSYESNTEYEEYRASRRSQHEIRGLQIDTSEFTSWQELDRVARFIDIFNEEVSWDEILEPCGWRYIREDYEGRREWARPGSDSKSAVTDWEESPHVMSLLSTSLDTGMNDLKEDGVSLTKFRVALRLLYNDNDNELFQEWKGLITGESQ